MTADSSSVVGVVVAADYPGMEGVVTSDSGVEGVVTADSSGVEGVVTADSSDAEGVVFLTPLVWWELSWLLTTLVWREL